MESPSRAERARTVLAYHERTKHHYGRYSAALGYLDWATQPDPFRRYEGAPLVELPLPAAGRELPYADLFTEGAVPAAPLDRHALSLFLRYALSLTAWKEIESARWALRANPSSGNLHPTEGYLVLPAIAGIAAWPAVHHYGPREHGLEVRAELTESIWRDLIARYPTGSFLVGLSSVHWREAWKYGERAYRYCQHDVGHALGSLRFAAAAVGWRLGLLDSTPDAAIAGLLGLDRDDDFGAAEREEPDLLALVVTDPEADMQRPWPAPAMPSVAAVSVASFCGRANVLSSGPITEWPIIETVAAAARHVDGGPAAERERGPAPVPPASEAAGRSAERVILGRRSCLALDGETTLARDVFYRMLTRVVPAAQVAPWDAVPWRPHVHLAVFVHRVDGLEPGLYALARDPARVELLRAAMRPGFAWSEPAACPSGLALFKLEAGDFRRLATGVSCGQEIAGAGAFSLAMLGELAAGVERFGPSFYRRLFWEAGLLGQVLYLEAEAAGIRGTGIGCYFDDPVHEVFGITGRDLQSLYHFTVGGPVEDRRLTTLAPYPESRG